MPTQVVSSTLTRIIGVSAAIRALRADIERFAAYGVSTLITGEMGTGKELCAVALFELSGRNPLVAVNCAAIPESLLDSEMFGYVRGAFTGAVKNHVGLVGTANGGTLFLDEVTELSMASQAKLLRVVEHREYRQVGSTALLKSEFRLIAATNADVDELVKRGLLRPDLLYRIGALRLIIPPLRERPEDIWLIAGDVLQQIRKRERSGPTRFTRPALHLLGEQRWPGNVRQLYNVVECAAARAGRHADVIDEEHLAQVFPEGSSIGHAVAGKGAVKPLKVREWHARVHAVRDALTSTGGNRREAARLLGISEAKLYRLMTAMRYELRDIPGTDSGLQN